MSDLRLIRGGRTERDGHVAADRFALYVIGALGPEAAEAVERHVAACEVCAEGLAREARLEAALERVACLADEREYASGEANVASLVPALAAAPQASARAAERARFVVGGRRSRWAGGIGGALAAAAAVVLALASTTAHSEPAMVTGIAQRAPALHDAAGDMSGAFASEVARGDSLDGG